jgi:hypothetical protein
VIIAYVHVRRGYCLFWNCTTKTWHMNQERLPSWVAKLFIKRECVKAVLPLPMNEGVPVN